MRKIHTLLDRKLYKCATKEEELIDKLVKIRRPGPGKVPPSKLSPSCVDLPLPRKVW